VYEFYSFSSAIRTEKDTRHSKKIVVICNAGRRQTNASFKDAESDLEDHEVLETEIEGKGQSWSERIRAHQANVLDCEIVKNI